MARTLADYGQATKLNREQQAAQVQYQNDNRQQSISDNQAKKASELAAEGQAEGAAYFQQQAQNLAVKNPTANQYDQVALPKGAIDQNAYDRLVKQGMTPTSALAEINGRQDVQQAFNQVGTTNGFQGSQAGLDRQQTRLGNPSQQIADLQSSLSKPPVEGDTSDTPQSRIQKQQQLNLLLEQQNIEQEGQRKQEASNAATTAASQDAAQASMPDTSALDAAIAGLGPEGQILGQALKANLAAAVEQEKAAAKNLGIELSEADASQAAYTKMLDRMDEQDASFTKQLTDFADKMQEKREESIAKQKENTIEQLKWEENRLARDAKQKLDKQVNQMVAAQAIGGGFGSSSWTAEIAEAEWRGEQAIMDMQKEFGFKRADVDIQFTEQLNGIYEYYGQQKLDALKQLKADKKQSAQYRFAATEKTNDRKAGARKEYNTTLANIAKEQASAIDKATDRVLGEMKLARQESTQKETLALQRIDYLLSNYDRADVQESIRELAKDVTSFNAATLADMDTTEAKKLIAKRAGSGGGSYAAYLPTGLKPQPQPEITYEEFAAKKIAELEQEQSISLPADKRAELIAENAEKWESEYQAAYKSGLNVETRQAASSEIAQEFGQPVLSAAQLVIDGTYGGTNPVKRAADAAGVSESQVAIAVAKLRQSGEVMDTAALSPEQNKAWKTVRSELTGDTFYTVWKGAESAVSRIETAIGDNGSADGVSDIMAINAFQNGIVDPGATVREGDVALMQSAAAWAEIVNLGYWKEKIRDGDKLPEATRQQMLSLARATRDAYKRDFTSKTLPMIQTLARQNSLPRSVVDDFLGPITQTTGQTYVTPKVSSFVDSLSE